MRNPLSRKARCQKRQGAATGSSIFAAFRPDRDIPVLSTAKTNAKETEGMISTGIQAPITEC
jgi:hypothetical protein